MIVLMPETKENCFMCGNSQSYLVMDFDEFLCLDCICAMTATIHDAEGKGVN